MTHDIDIVSDRPLLDWCGVDIVIDHYLVAVGLT